MISINVFALGFNKQIIPVAFCNSQNTALFIIVMGILQAFKNRLWLVEEFNEVYDQMQPTSMFGLWLNPS